MGRQGVSARPDGDGRASRWRAGAPRGPSRAPTSRRAACSRTAAPTCARGQEQAGARQLRDHRQRLLGHRLGGRRAARDRALPDGGRGRRDKARRPSSRCRSATRRATARPAPTTTWAASRWTGPPPPPSSTTRWRSSLRVERLYPAQPLGAARAVRDRALAHRKAGRLAEALEAARRVTLEYPSSEAAPEAHFQAGHLLALMGEPRQAMEEFQRDPQPLRAERVGAARARPHHRPLPPVRVRPAGLRASTPPTRSGPATCSRTCAPS